MYLYTNYVSVYYVINLILAIVIIFFERKKPTSTLAWLMILYFVPVLGFFIYLIFGQNLSKRKIFHYKKIEKKFLDLILNMQLKDLEERKLRFKDSIAYDYKDMIYMHIKNSASEVTMNNSIKLYTKGEEKFTDLFQDIRKAKKHIHLEYYIVKNDELGKQLMSLLIEKAKEGVEVRFLMDAFGSRFMIRSKKVKELKAVGGKVGVFFASKIPLINMKVNFRNHRKMVIIDGKIGYIGGFNVGNEYLGLDERMGNWRDNHLRIEGSAVDSLQLRFLLDWRTTNTEQVENFESSFVFQEDKDGQTVQIVASGPDQEWEQIKYGYLKMINSAKESIYIQTPYFVPDDSMLEALKIAALSGIDVKIMIPDKPDHMFVYWATYSYLGEVINAGGKGYLYNNGFLHSKTIIVDGKIASVGSANIDVRSFKLNFEANAFVYDHDFAGELRKEFDKDLEVSLLVDEKKYESRGRIIKIKESISRLLSPIL
ncbi:MAG: cardiolipin synthase [Firmicutes bacterium]|nr:cardiolipin synthase [Bacillota bacterium]